MISATHDAKHGIGPDESETRQHERRDRERRDENVARRVRRIGEQQRAGERAAAAALVRHDDPVDDERDHEQSAADAQWRPGCGARPTSSPTLCRSSSKQVMERKPTMPSVPSVSNFS